MSDDRSIHENHCPMAQNNLVISLNEGPSVKKNRGHTKKVTKVTPPQTHEEPNTMRPSLKKQGVHSPGVLLPRRPASDSTAAFADRVLVHGVRTLLLRVLQRLLQDLHLAQSVAARADRWDPPFSRANKNVSKGEGLRQGFPPFSSFFSIGVSDSWTQIPGATHGKAKGLSG